MEALLNGWLDGLDATRVIDEASVAEARRIARDCATASGMRPERAERVALVASELSRNQLRHARRGRFAAQPTSRDGVPGVELVFADAGDGLADPTKALAGTARSTGSLGVGVATAHDNADEMDFDVRLGEGTCIRARLFDGEVVRRREVGIYGRPYAGEAKSGDHAAFFRTDDALVVALCDGLGHGPAARDASLLALATTAQHRATVPEAIVEACHRAMSGTRGGVLAVLRLRDVAPGRAELDVASVGNITVELARLRATRRFAATSFVVGAPQKAWRAHVETSVAEADETLAMYTDGIPSRVSLTEDPDLLREHPIVIAQQLVERHGRETDDVLVVIAR